MKMFTARARVARLVSLSFVAAILSACSGGSAVGFLSSGEDTGNGTGTPTGIPLAVAVAVGNEQIVADGVSTTAVAVTLVDTAGQPMAGKTINLTRTAGTLSAASGTTDSAGQFVVFLKSSTTIGQSTITAVEPGSGISGTAVVRFIAGAAASIVLSASPTTVAPNRPTSVTVRALDANGNPAPDKSIRLNATDGTGSYANSTGQTDSSGTFTTTFTPTASTSLSATLVNENITSAAVAVTLNPNAAVVGNLSVNAIVPSVNADGSSQAVVRATVTDVNGAVIPGIAVSFTTLGGSPTPSSATVNTLSNGNADFALSSLTPGSVTVRASSGGVSRSVNVAFVGSAAVDTISLLASSPQLQSGATTVGQGVTVTALLKDAGNNVITGANVAFSSARVSAGTCGRGGALTVQRSTTDTSGTAAAVLTTGGDTQNQTIAVTASSGGRSATISIAVTGTSLQISGPTTLGLGATGVYAISLKDSAGNGIANQTVTLTTATPPGNSVAPASVITDANGQATVTYTATNGGTDTISASTAGGCNTAAQSVIVSTQALAFVVSGTSADQNPTTADFVIAALGADQSVNVGTTSIAAQYSVNDIVRISDGTREIVGIVRGIGTSLLTVRTTAIVSGAAADTMTTGALVTEINNEVVIDPGIGDETNVLAQTFKVRLTGGTIAGQAITFTTTRGTLSGATATDANGVATVRVSQATGASGTGGGVLTATAPSGISTSQTFNVVSHDPQTLSLQATPNNVPATRDSTIKATVRDSFNNPVKDTVVNFTLADSSGGALSAASAITDGQGIATLLYTASNNPSARDGVTVTGTLAGTAITATTTLTVGGQAVRITMGTGNTVFLGPDPSTTYRLPYSVIVTDSANNPPSSTPSVSLLLQPLAYAKGVLVCGTDNESPPWSPGTVGTPNVLGYGAHANSGTVNVQPPAPLFGGANRCRNEDANFNGIRDPAEDDNGDGDLDPGNVALVQATATPAQLQNGVATFDIIYNKNRAYWVQVRVTAVVNVSGTESRASETFILPPNVDDYDDCEVAPPGQSSPYGTVLDCNDFR